MKKLELVAKLARESGVSKSAIKLILKTFTKTIIISIKKEKRFPVAGLGVFHLVKRAKRTCHTPLTKKPVLVKAHHALTFKPAPSVKRNLA
jgi:nucleoid DNA-binding protein